MAEENYTSKKNEYEATPKVFTKKSYPNEIASDPKNPPLIGRVEKGLSDMAGWMKKFNELYRKKTGVVLFPGTLNVCLDKPFYVTSADYVEQLIVIEKGEEEYGIKMYILPCQINGLQIFIFRPERNENGTGQHPAEMIEIACQIKLREAFQLDDGDKVEITVNPSLHYREQIGITLKPF